MPFARRSLAFSLLAVVTLSGLPARAAREAFPVSPGAADRAVDIASPCPTFSWGNTERDGGSELAVYEVGADERTKLVFTHRIGGGASSWTPARADCLMPGREYAWLVRPLAKEEAEWSAPLRFRVPGAPSQEELAAALAVLERWNASGGGAAAATAAGSAGSAQGRAGSSGGTSSGPTAGPEVSPGSSVAAIRGDVVDTSGAAFGVFGISHSPQGAGLVGRNESTGADLILDGTFNGEVDTAFTQAGIDRSSAAPQTFNVQNSGGGMTLQVNGVAVDTATTPISWTTRLTGIPAGFADGIDNDTNYTAGNQLQLAGTVFNVVEGPGSGLDADTLDGLQGTSLQARVTGSCPLGMAIQGVNADGSVTCYEVPVPPRINTVDTPVWDIGADSSIAVGTDGFPVIGYYDDSAGSLRVTKCNDAACAGNDETTTTVDNDPSPTAVLGQYASIAIGSDGFPVISYSADTAGSLSLRVAKCNDAACAGNDETITTVDATGDAGWYTSIAIGSDNLPVISYYGTSVFSGLKVAKCDDVACASTTINIVDPASNDEGIHNSITIGTDGFPVISYYDSTAQRLKVAKCNDAACDESDETINFVGSVGQGGIYTSIAIGSDGFPVISWYQPGAAFLSVTKCNDPACAGNNETINTVDDPANSVGEHSSIAIGSGGFPVISYYDSTAGALKVARCNDDACAGNDETITTVDDPASDVGRSTSIAIGTDGLPVISYYDMSAGALKVAKCRNASCSD